MANLLSVARSVLVDVRHVTVLVFVVPGTEQIIDRLDGFKVVGRRHDDRYILTGILMRCGVATFVVAVHAAFGIVLG